jgi:hypothetical protein
MILMISKAVDSVQEINCIVNPINIVMSFSTYMQYKAAQLCDSCQNSRLQDNICIKVKLLFLSLM